MKVYLDHSATTPVDPAVLECMLPYFSECAGNANSLHSFGRAAAAAVDKARGQVAAAIGCKPQEVYFTSGGTESDNWALKGIAAKNREKGDHIIISAIEHAAMLSSAKQLEKQGFRISYLGVDSDGIVKLDELERIIDDKTILVSVMTANNEIGTIQPIREIAKIAHTHGALMHTDAVQAVGNIPVDVRELDVDLLSLSGHKFYGPKGIGVLYKRTGVAIEPLNAGGHQERTMRGGTTNVPAVVGIGAAIELAMRNLAENAAHERMLRDRFAERVLAEIPDAIYNGSKVHRLPGNANISFRYIEGESILQMLDIQGIAVSTGSACSSGSLEPSHVMLAIGCTIPQSHSSIRFSFGKENTVEETDYVAEKLAKCIRTLREMSPLYHE